MLSTSQGGGGCKYKEFLRILVICLCLKFTIWRDTNVFIYYKSDIMGHLIVGRQHKKLLSQCQIYTTANL